MAFDLSKIKGISDDVKMKLTKVKNKEEFEALVKAENLSVEQLKELSGGISDDCIAEGIYCWSDFVCCPIDK